MHIYLMRHGECEANVAGVTAGSRVDSPITETGRHQAYEAAQKLKAAGIEVIVSSPLQRALATAEIVHNELSLVEPIIVNDLFKERDIGDMTGQLIQSYFDAELTGPIAGAETETALFMRAKNAVAFLKHLDETVLVVTHNGLYRMMRCVLEDLPPHAFRSVTSITNTEVYEVEA